MVHPRLPLLHQLSAPSRLRTPQPASQPMGVQPFTITVRGPALQVQPAWVGPIGGAPSFPITFTGTSSRPPALELPKIPAQRSSGLTSSLRSKVQNNAALCAR